MVEPPHQALAPAPTPSWLDGLGLPAPNILVAGSVVLLLVSCLLFGVGSSDGVSDVYAYLGLCLGPIGLIGAAVGVGLLALNRSRRS